MPAKVIHLDTLANMSDWVQMYSVPGFSQKICSYRHFRIMRATGGTVWLQATANMDSWGNPLDSWRGLRDHTNYTTVFAEVIPNLWLDYLAGVLPAASTKIHDAEALEKYKSTIEALQGYFHHVFSVESHHTDTQSSVHLTANLIFTCCFCLVGGSSGGLLEGCVSFQCRTRAFPVGERRHRYVF